MYMYVNIQTYINSFKTWMDMSCRNLVFGPGDKFKIQQIRNPKFSLISVLNLWHHFGWKRPLEMTKSKGIPRAGPILLGWNQVLNISTAAESTQRKAYIHLLQSINHVSKLSHHMSVTWKTKTKTYFCSCALTSDFPFFPFCALTCF